MAESKNLYTYNDEQDDMDIPNGFECPILFELMKDPVMAADGHTYERKAIETWIKSGKKTSPLTNDKLPHTLLTPNHSLRKAIDDFLKKRPTLKVIKQMERERQTAEDELSSLQLAIELREQDLIAKMAKLNLDGESKAQEDKPPSAISITPSAQMTQSPVFSSGSSSILSTTLILSPHTSSSGFLGDSSAPPILSRDAKTKDKKEVKGNDRQNTESLVLYRMGDNYATLGNYQKALPVLLQAAEWNYPPAFLRLGQIYGIAGYGVPKDEKTSQAYYQKAGSYWTWFKDKANKGEAEGQYYVGLCYSNGAGVTNDLIEAARWYRMAAEQGNADAQYYLGWCYEDGTGIIKDLRAAVLWYRAAAEQGNTSAQCALSSCYFNGTGVTKDLVEMVRWYRVAAQQENSEAQYYLGWCYESGTGMLKDLSEAVHWYQAAAEQGNAYAQDNLKTLLETNPSLRQQSSSSVFTTQLVQSPSNSSQSSAPMPAQFSLSTPSLHSSQPVFFSETSNSSTPSRESKIKIISVDEKKRLQNELIKACEEASLSRVEYAVAEGALVNLLNEQDKNPLYCAVYGMNPEVVQYVIEQLDKQVSTASWQACEEHNRNHYGQIFFNMEFNPKTYQDWYDLLCQIETNEFLSHCHLVQVWKHWGVMNSSCSNFGVLKITVAREASTGWAHPGIDSLGQTAGMAISDTESGYKTSRTQIKKNLETTLQATWAMARDLYQKAEKYYFLRDYQKALPLLLQVIELNYPPAFLRLGDIYNTDGYGIPKDEKTSQVYYKKAGSCLAWIKDKADKRDAEGQYYLGICYANGAGVAQGGRARKCEGAIRFGYVL